MQDVSSWGEIEAALESVDGVLTALGNLAGWKAGERVCITTLIRACGSVASQLTLLACLGYVTVRGQTVAITVRGIEAVVGERDDREPVAS